MANTAVTFPVIDAMILTPKEGSRGQIAICSNTTAPGQVLSEIDPSLREYVSIIGPLITSRDGSERMIINSLAHPTMRYLILFSEESATFAPCTNLLLAIMKGFDPSRVGNYIAGGIAASPHYPNINKRLFNAFKENIYVLPIFMSKQRDGKKTVNQYLDWLKPRVNQEIHEVLVSINNQDKIYYDSLRKLLTAIVREPRQKKTVPELTPSDFQHLQPPKINLKPKAKRMTVPFRITKSNSLMRIDIKVGNQSYFLKGNDPFLISYSLMKYLGRKKDQLSPLTQLLLGAEMGRVNTEIINKVSFPSFVRSLPIVGSKFISLEPNTRLVVDKKYYYRISVDQGKISVMCLAYDVCDTVFELISKEPKTILERIALDNRFDQYEMDILHRLDVGAQIGQAAVAAGLGFSFIQDFSPIFKTNTKKLPTLLAVGDSFLDVHKKIIREIYTEGVTENHGDPWKGLARSACVLAVFRQASKALKTMPILYKQGDQEPVQMRANYKKQLLRKDHDGTYSYGQRTRSYFGVDQLKTTIETLKKDPTRATIVQRFDPATDMSEYIDPTTGKARFTHDPCLTHDIYFIQKHKLNAFHIARAHNIVNAYPENIFGLFDAYTKKISQVIRIPIGDVFMLSSRANILLLTEDQRAKKIMSEPSQPEAESNSLSGPCRLDLNPPATGGVAYLVKDLKATRARPRHSALKHLESYEQVNTVSKALDYLAGKGAMHNNVVLSEYYVGKSNSQANQLAFLQMNVFAKKVYVTAVFMNRSLAHKTQDINLMNYLATKLKDKLDNKIALGQLSLYYVAYKK